MITKTTTSNYLYYLESKGFRLKDDAKGFIDFGQKYTQSSDQFVNIAIEITLKAQREFDGSFFMSVLETLIQQNLTDKKKATQLFLGVE